MPRLRNNGVQRYGVAGVRVEIGAAAVRPKWAERERRRSGVAAKGNGVVDRDRIVIGRRWRGGWSRRRRWRGGWRRCRRRNGRRAELQREGLVQRDVKAIDIDDQVSGSRSDIATGRTLF